MRSRAEDQIALVMIRHGATESNREHRYLGRTDEPLSEEGIRELSEYRKLQGYPAVDRLFSSPMRRCMQTAEILYPDLAPVCMEEWAEMDFGAFEGKNYQELKDDDRYRRWVESNGTLPFPDGERREDFILRCEKGFQRMMKIAGWGKDRERAKALGMIVHGGTIMALLSRYGGGDYFDYQAANGKGYACICKGKGVNLEFTGLKKL